MKNSRTWTSLRISSAGDIDDDNAGITDITASVINLDAVDGIGATTAIGTAASTIDADTTGAGAASIDLDNTLATAVNLQGFTTVGTAATITFDQTGGGNVSTSGDMTTTDGAIALNVDSGNLDMSGDNVAVFQFYAIARIRHYFGDGTFHFNQFFFCHIELILLHLIRRTCRPR